MSRKCIFIFKKSLKVFVKNLRVVCVKIRQLNLIRTIFIPTPPVVQSTSFSLIRNLTRPTYSCETVALIPI